PSLCTHALHAALPTFVGRGGERAPDLRLQDPVPRRIVRPRCPVISVPPQYSDRNHNARVNRSAFRFASTPVWSVWLSKSLLHEADRKSTRLNSSHVKS